MKVSAVNSACGHVHKYEAGLRTLRKSEKLAFCYKIIIFHLSSSKFQGMFFLIISTSWYQSKSSKSIDIQTIDKKVTLLLIYLFDAFSVFPTVKFVTLVSSTLLLFQNLFRTLNNNYQNQH